MLLFTFDPSWSFVTCTLGIIFDEMGVVLSRPAGHLL